MYAFDDGRYWLSAEHRNDIINVPEEPERTSEFRGFNSRRQGGINGDMVLGGWLYYTLEAAKHSSFTEGEGVLELIREGDRLVDVKFHPKDA